MGGSPAPAPPKTYSPMEQAEAQLMLQQAEAQRAEDNRRREEEDRLRREQEQRERTAGQVSNLYNTGQSYLDTRLNNLGYDDYYGIADLYLGALHNAKMQVPDTATSPGDYFNYDQKFRSALTDAEKAQQTRLHNQFMDLTPVGWQDTYIPQDYGSDVYGSILDSQLGDVNTRFQTALDRGQMNASAYDNAQRRMQEQRSAAESQLREMAQGVLGGYRSQLSDFVDQYSDRIQNYSLGQNLDISNLGEMKQQRANTLLQGFEGDLRRSLGDTQLFNPDTIMSRASAAAGVSNNPLRQAFGGPSSAGDQFATDERTTGTSGVF